MVENVKKGMTVFGFDSIHDPVEEGVVEDPTVRERTDGHTTWNSVNRINWKYRIEDENGTRSETPAFGCSSFLFENIFPTAKEAFEVKNKLVKEYKDKLRAEIVDLTSLFRFPVQHCLFDCEYADRYAKEVYEEYVGKYEEN